MLDVGCWMFFSFATGLLQAPIVAAIGMTMTMRGKKSTAMFPEPRPDFFTIRLRQFQTGERCARKKLEPSLAMRGRQRCEMRFHFEQKHQPMVLTFVPMFTDQAGQMQIGRLQVQRQFFPGFATGAGVRGFAEVRVQFAAARAPQTEVRLLRALEQQDFVARIETVKQRRQFVREGHADNLPSGGKAWQALTLVES